MKTWSTMQVAWWFMILTMLCRTTVGSSSSSSGLYTSVTALDKYGNSVQLRHARESSSRYGTLIVAARSSTEVVVVSLFTPRPGVLTHSRSVLERVSSIDPESTMMICTGVKADASWLVRLMREYSSRAWERYNVAPSPSRVADALSEAFLSFMGYDRSLEWHDGVGPVIMDSGDEDDVSNQWARPLGVQALVVSPTASHVVLVEPSGVQHTHLAYAIGRESDSVNTQLMKRFKANLDTQEVRDLLVEVVRNVMQDSSRRIKDETQIVVEILSSQGVDLSCEPLQSKS